MKTIELEGGLGDLLYDFYVRERYIQLEDLPEGERLRVVIVSSNPAVKELFQWHPKFSQLDIVEIPATYPWGREERAAHGLPEPDIVHPIQGVREVVYYPSPTDRPLLDGLRDTPYVLFHLSSGIQSRTIPWHISEEASDIAIKMGLHVVLVGRNYRNNTTWGENGGDVRFRIQDRFEQRLAPRPGLTDLVDRLSFPGTACLLQRARASLVCQSCVSILSWRLRIPTYSLYDPEHESRWWDNPSFGTFGKDYDTSEYASFYKWDGRAFQAFLEKWAKKP